MNGGPEKRNGGARREASGTGEKTKATRNVRATGGMVEATRQETAVEPTGNTERLKATDYAKRKVAENRWMIGKEKESMKKNGQETKRKV